MSHEIKIPAVGESVTSGQISKWHFADGATVKKGDLLITLETDKVAAEISAEASGVLRIQKKEGEDVDVGSVVGLIEEGAAVPEAAAAPAPAPEKPAKAAAAAKPADAPKATKAAAEPAKPAPAPEAKPAPAPAPAAPASSSSERVTRKKMSPLRRKIAEQLVNAQHTAALLTTFNECDMSAVMAMRSKLQDSFVAKHGVKLVFMSFFVKAVVDALKAVPQVNVRVEGDEIVTQHFYDVGVAVGTERGLVVPILRDADQKSFADIEKDILGYAAKAKGGQLQIADLTGGVFTISNGGVYGSMLSTPIIN
ncbi:MAG: Dihydrolipoyllysine succinyltransferase, partial [Verrucomicrobiaceae bacterium]|nr:Dihydrolipoyllysine succinyltransferase [Verrucomicrobiaceae bacterium]